MGGLTFAPVVEDGLTFSGFLPAADVPVDPSGADWRGVAGPPGPVGPAGGIGPAGPVGPAGEDGVALFSWPSAAGESVANGDYVLVLSWPWAIGNIIGLAGATANGSFDATVLVNGVTVPGLSGVLVNSPVPVTAVAGVNSIVAGATVVLRVSATAAGFNGGFNSDFLSSDFVVGVSAPPTDAAVQVSYARSPLLAAYPPPTPIIATGLTAAGTTQTTAFPLPALTNIFSTVAPGSAGILPATIPIATRRVVNVTATDLLIYPPVGAAIGSNLVDEPVIVSPSQSVDFMTQSAASQWYAA